MGRKRDSAAAQQSESLGKSPTVRGSRSRQDRQSEERRRMAERLVQALRTAGYSCALAEEGHARASERL